MSEKTKPELILETVKVLLWPLLIVLAVLWFGSDLKDILKNRSFKIGLVEVGDRINNLEGSVQDELILQKDYLNLILDNAEDPSRVRDLTNEALQTIESAQMGIKKEIQNISSIVPELTQSMSENKSRISSQAVSVKDWEVIGFNEILAHGIEEAIFAFTEAEKSQPDFHNVSEIRRLLVKNKNSLEDPESEVWEQVYNKILADYSWGMPTLVRQKMRADIKN